MEKNWGDTPSATLRTGHTCNTSVSICQSYNTYALSNAMYTIFTLDLVYFFNYLTYYTDECIYIH